MWPTAPRTNCERNWSSRRSKVKRGGGGVRTSIYPPPLQPPTTHPPPKNPAVSTPPTTEEEKQLSSLFPPPSTLKNLAVTLLLPPSTQECQVWLFLWKKNSLFIDFCQMDFYIKKGTLFSFSLFVFFFFQHCFAYLATLQPTCCIPAPPSPLLTKFLLPFWRLKRGYFALVFFLPSPPPPPSQHALKKKTFGIVVLLQGPFYEGERGGGGGRKEGGRIWFGRSRICFWRERERQRQNWSDQTLLFSSARVLQFLYWQFFAAQNVGGRK